MNPKPVQQIESKILINGLNQNLGEIILIQITDSQLVAQH